MELITQTPLVFSRKGFPRDGEGKPYLPGETLKEALTSAVIFHSIKKDKQLESKVRNYLTSKGLKLTEIAEDVKRFVCEKYPLLNNLQIPKKVYLPAEKLTRERIKILDLKRKEDVGHFETEVFRGSLEIEIAFPSWERLKSACHSFAEALAHIERNFLREHPLGERFYEELLNDIKHWEIPLRLGLWTEVHFKGDLLFFWKIKEVRKFLIKELGIDIRPRYVLYLPKENVTVGWAELRK
ncbi:MAG TPA: hypothetical protein EYH48_05475 [Aquifex aeolicus]|uniref:Uncharacterized protein n=1 Tax=Aquifex aeolicus TaxID=63363 RepID=A0A9D0YQ64_AQUAO|nr:hypothetical protein [Aquifex sp.]HIP98533.1 hypothetical protein [Aquifex aeolicus]HIQ26757.1 hypothetical protein [Aquifex aeolicus]